MIRGTMASTRSLSGALASTRGGGTPPYLAGGAPSPTAVYDPMGAASLAASYVNIVNPGTNDAAPGVAPTHAPGTGWTFGGAQYLTTGITPGITWSMLVRFANASSSIGGVGAYTSTTNNFFLRPWNAGGQRSYNNGGERHIAGHQVNCVMAVAGKACYLNGSSDGTIVAGGSNTKTIGIGSVDVDVPQFFYTGNILYVIIWNTSTNHATWMPAVSAAVAAL